uniref:UPAR/Ly6 domain-containing protein n=1 Tax=Sander lucioperca TaxID=283035 RepID=A0A8C9XVP9_SANLU
MHLLPLMFGILLHPEMLRVYTGASGTCTQTIKECPQGQQCAAMRVVTYADGSKVQVLNKQQCLDAEYCGEYSLNYGKLQYKFITKCCTSELCNTQPAPEPSKLPNGKKCYYCDERTCNNTVNCDGTEDNCFSATQNQGTVILKGCVSKHMCTMRDQSWARPLTYRCCEGNLCNAASSFSAGLVLLAAPLLSLLGISY